MIRLLDCTLRDGGYYNAWNFPDAVVREYLSAARAAAVDVVELGFRSLKSDGFKGACAFTTDEYLRGLGIPDGLAVSVMVNASELITGGRLSLTRLEALFPEPASVSPVTLVRIACHYDETELVLPASEWLADHGYQTGVNLMQISDRTADELERIAGSIANWPIEVLYFADSMGGLDPDGIGEVVAALRRRWSGAIGVHTHDNMGRALANSLRALAQGATWVDATVTGMGRGPGNVQTEYMALEFAERRGGRYNAVPLMSLIRRYFQPLKRECGWGANLYYYLAGKYGIHPSYVQEMLGDARYTDEDILAVINHLRVEGGKRFSVNTLDAARHFFQGTPRGTWNPASSIGGREVLLLGSGPGVADHRAAIERYVRRARPYVLALNTQGQVDAELIDARVACHPVRLLADCETHKLLPQPLITPASMLPEDVKQALQGKQLLDFGLGMEANTFQFETTHCILPSSLVVAYALAIATSGAATRVLLAGFDGYGAGDPRTLEMQHLLATYQGNPRSLLLQAITPTTYSIPASSVYSLR